MKLRDLNPRYSRIYAHFTPEQGGTDPLPAVHLCFECPKCKGWSLCINVGTEPADQSKGRWHCDALPVSPAWIDNLTITPSIQCHSTMHGPRGPDCNAHFSIINGEIVP